MLCSACVLSAFISVTVLSKVGCPSIFPALLVARYLLLCFCLAAWHTQEVTWPGVFSKETHLLARSQGEGSSAMLQRRPRSQCAGSRSQEGSQAGRGQSPLHSDPLSHTMARVILTLSIRFFKRALFLIIHLIDNHRSDCCWI